MSTNKIIWIKRYNMDGLNFADLDKNYLSQVALIERESIADPWSENLIAGLIDDSRAVARVGVIDGEAVCYYSFYTVLDEADVNNLAVKICFRRRGIGAALMMDMIDQARLRKVLSLTLEVRSGNHAAISLYEKFGFVAEGVRKKFYKDGEDALIMWKRDI